jgi:hypothetical protein
MNISKYYIHNNKDQLIKYVINVSKTNNFNYLLGQYSIEQYLNKHHYLLYNFIDTKIIKHKLSTYPAQIILESIRI